METAGSNYLPYSKNSMGSGSKEKIVFALDVRWDAIGAEQVEGWIPHLEAASAK